MIILFNAYTNLGQKIQDQVFEQIVEIAHLLKDTEESLI